METPPKAKTPENQLKGELESPESKDIPNGEGWGEQSLGNLSPQASRTHNEVRCHGEVRGPVLSPGGQFRGIVYCPCPAK